jgi:acyl CoA:acetate/3-ketoacid CoA transferase alpha subunit
VADALLARAARRTIVTYERRVKADPARAAISRLWIDAAVEAPGGAAPTACAPHYGVDSEGLKAL